MKRVTNIRYHELRIPGRFDPLALVARLTDAQIFQEYVVYERAGTWCIAGDELASVALDRSRVVSRCAGDETAEPATDEPLHCVRRALERLPVHGWRAYGWLGFEYAYLAAGRSSLVGDRPLMHLMVPRTEVQLRTDHAVIRGLGGGAVDSIRDLLLQPTRDVAYETIPVDLYGESPRAYEEMVASALDEIRRGLFEKVILSRCVPVEGPVDFAGTYVLGRSANQPARSFVLHLGGRKAVGFSPETVVEVSDDGRVSTQPLAGSRALGLGAETDKRLRAQLLSDPKEIFEHAISVKLAYDELGTLCVPGSVVVNDLMTVKLCGSVQHLGSRIVGQLPAELSAWDALHALFPAVTASGIPKLQVYDCIARLEQQPRDLYAGAILTTSSDGEMDAALVLRTLFEEDGRAWLRAGAGIVSHSRPAREYEETCEKLRSIAPYVARGRAAALPHNVSNAGAA